MQDEDATATVKSSIHNLPMLDGVNTDLALARMQNPLARHDENCFEIGYWQEVPTKICTFSGPHPAISRQWILPMHNRIQSPGKWPPSQEQQRLCFFVWGSLIGLCIAWLYKMRTRFTWNATNEEGNTCRKLSRPLIRVFTSLQMPKTFDPSRRRNGSMFSDHSADAPPV
jgi:hypothetical protein